MAAHTSRIHADTIIDKCCEKPYPPFGGFWAQGVAVIVRYGDRYLSILRSIMNIASSTSVQAATAAVQSETADSVNILVLKKALDVQAASAMTLLQALPLQLNDRSVLTERSV